MTTNATEIVYTDIHLTEQNNVEDVTFASAYVMSFLRISHGLPANIALDGPALGSGLSALSSSTLVFSLVVGSLFYIATCTPVERSITYRYRVLSIAKSIKRKHGGTSTQFLRTRNRLSLRLCSSTRNN